MQRCFFLSAETITESSVHFRIQHTLVTEIRELVFPEDRTRYDELVYRRDAYLTDRDRHRVSERQRDETR